MEIVRASDLGLSIVVPVYLSEPILPHLVDKVREAACEAGYEGRFELILVNDASPDGSWRVIKSLAAARPFVKGICLRRNVGQHNAIMAGLNHAAGEFVVMMDDDLQHPPSAIGRMVRAMEAGYDVCYTEYVGRRHPLWKKLGSKFNDVLATWVLGKPKNLYLSSFKAMRRQVLEEVVKYDGPYPYVDGLILDVTNSITTIPIQHGDRLAGQGDYGFRRSVSLWLKMVTSFSVVPLRVASFSGLVIAGVSLIAIVTIVANKLLYPQTSAGWSSLIAVILFMGGLQLLCLGVIGEYLGRAYLKINHKPQFAVRETVGELPVDESAAPR